MKEVAHALRSVRRFCVAPASFDVTPQQFLGLSADPVGVVLHLAHYPGAAYDSLTADAERRLEHLRDGIAGLRDGGAEIVLQVGDYWSLPYIGHLELARELQDDLSEAYGVQVNLNWVAMADALTAVGAKRIAVAAGYYRPEWTLRRSTSSLTPVSTLCGPVTSSTLASSPTSRRNSASK